MPNPPEGEKPKLLVFSASPIRSTPLNLPNEVERIREGLRYFDQPIQLESCVATTPERLYTQLLFHKPDYVHFCGHGLGRKGLVLTDEAGNETPVTAQALGSLFEYLRNKVRCVVLNACYSRIQAEAIAQHIAFVIGMNAEIGDVDAINFSVAFYKALAAGEPVPAAFGLARSMMQLQPSAADTHRSRHLAPNVEPSPYPPPHGAHLIPELFQREEQRDLAPQRTEKPGPSHSHFRINTLESALTALQQASKPSITRAQERLEPSASGEASCYESIKPIARVDTGPDLHAFLESPNPLQLILGDSGYGKSTLLYQFANIRDVGRPVYTLFYDIHEIEQKDSLRNRLAADLHCEPRDLVDTLNHLSKIVGSREGRLLILVDAINEAQTRNPEVLRTEIQGLAEQFPPEIKLIYSCRQVYWNLYLEGGQTLPRKLYFGSSAFILPEYSPTECQRAFEHYKQAYGLQGSFEELAVELRDKIRDPLMLRMLSEGYAGRALPAFAPAVLVFQTYKRRIARRFAATHVVGFLDAVIDFKAKQLLEGAGGTYDDQLVERGLLSDPDIRHLHFGQLNDSKKPQKPLLLLEDEGVLQSLDDAHTRFRFTYDRFYEYLLGRAIGPRLLEGSGPFDLGACLEKHIGSGDRLEIGVWQALKSELVRRNLEPTDDTLSLYSSSGLFSLLRPESGPVSAFARELLRELVFEARPVFAERLLHHLGEDPRWMPLLVDIAPDSPRMLPALADALLSGDQHLARRVCHSIARFSSIGGSHEVFEHLLRERLEARLRSPQFSDQATSLRGLVYYSAVVFVLALSSGANPAAPIRKLWGSILDILPAQSTGPRRVIASRLWDVVQQEGPLFFCEEDRVDGMEYLWETLDDSLKDRALEMARCCVDAPPSLHRDVLEIISFFAAKQRRWDLRRKPEQDEVYGYKLEFKLAQWLLIYWSQRNYGEVAQILQTLAEGGHWVHKDFALCTMEFILKHNYADDDGTLQDGFHHMKEWTRRFEEDLPERFYATLNESDPFNVNYIPIAQLAGIDTVFFAPSHGPIPTLETRFVGSDLRARRLALIACRYLWREHPEKVLGSLRLLLDDADPQVSDWLERILREVYMVYPRLVERFLLKLRVDRTRSSRIKHGTAVKDPSGLRHDVDPLMRFLFLGSDRVRAQTMEWYRRLLQSAGPQEFMDELVGFLLQTP